jgi:hypothetical protein
MAVQSKDMPPNTRRKDTAIINGRSLIKAQTPLEQFVAATLLILSFIGAVLAFNGGKLWPLMWYAVLGGIALQCPVTCVEWIYHPARNGINRWYAIAFVFGAGSTVLGFGPILLPPLVGVFAGLSLPMVYGVPGATMAGGIVLVVLSAILEMAPESILVD